MARHGDELEAVARPALFIVHDIPGRLRLRLPNVPALEGLASELRAVPGIVDCAYSPRTGSLRIHYDRAAIRPDAIVEWVASRGAVAVPEPDRAPASRPVKPRSERPAFSIAVQTTMAELNRRVRRMTGSAFDVPGLLVAALVVWAAREVMRGRVAPLAWSTALWYAHGLFHDYNVVSHRE